MLILRRKEGQWVNIKCNCGCGNMMRFRAYEISGEHPGKVNLAFDDKERHFTIERPERYNRDVTNTD